MRSALLDKWANKATQSCRPMQASLELTNRCNERCRHCYIPTYEDDAKRTLTLVQWYRVLDQLRGAGVLNLILMGGEAMLNRHFWRIVEYGANKGFFMSMITNGLLLHSKATQRLSRLGMANVTISLYSLDPKIHDGLTSLPGSHARTMKAIYNCQDSGLRVGVNCLLTRENIDSYWDLYDWAVLQNIEIKPDLIVTPRYDGNAQPTRLRATSSQIQNFFETLDAKFPGCIEPRRADENSYVCNAAKGKCAVTAYGDLLPCIEVREPLGNLVRQSFHEIWNRPQASKWRELRYSQLDRKKPYASFCDHCPGMSNNESGQPMQLSSYQLEVAKIKSKFYHKST